MVEFEKFDPVVCDFRKYLRCVFLYCGFTLANLSLAIFCLSFLHLINYKFNGTSVSYWLCFYFQNKPAICVCISTTQCYLEANLTPFFFFCSNNNHSLSWV